MKATPASFALPMASVRWSGIVPNGATVVEVQIGLVDIPVEQIRIDALQTFVKQETVFVVVRTADGIEGVGYSYTIGTGGRAVMSLLQESLVPVLLGRDVTRPEEIWAALYGVTRATMVGVVTTLALAAIDTAVWDARCLRAALPLSAAAGGARDRVPVYDTEGGWLHFSTDELVAHAVSSKELGFRGLKVKVGKPRLCEDVERLVAIREAVGWDVDLMVDANQSFTPAEAIRRAAAVEAVGLRWFEEPIPADDVAGHQLLARATSVPIAVGESIYSLGHIREYLQRGAASLVQVDVARIGGITPWLKVAHLAEAFNVAVAPHFLMEIHVSLVCAIPNGLYLEYIPQLRAITENHIVIDDGQAIAPVEPGLGIQWNFERIASS